MGVFGPLQNWRSYLSIRNGVLLLKQLIHSTADYACHTRRFVARSPVGRLQIIQSKCLRLVLPETLVEGRFTRILEFHSLPTTLEH